MSRFTLNAPSFRACSANLPQSTSLSSLHSRHSRPYLTRPGLDKSPTCPVPLRPRSHTGALVDASEGAFEAAWMSLNRQAHGMRREAQVKYTLVGILSREKDAHRGLPLNASPDMCTTPQHIPAFGQSKWQRHTFEWKAFEGREREVGRRWRWWWPPPGDAVVVGGHDSLWGDAQHGRVRRQRSH